MNVDVFMLEMENFAATATPEARRAIAKVAESVKLGAAVYGPVRDFGDAKAFKAVVFVSEVPNAG